jgi:hypothetical protein
MNTFQKLPLLSVLFLSGPIWGSGHSAYLTKRTDIAPPTVSQVASPAQLMQMKMHDVCAHADKNLDGYISRLEFTALRKTDTAFKATDVDHDGRLSLHECVRVLGLS